jgi:AraC-like DNA-binding protein
MKSKIFKNSKLDFIELRYVRDIENCVKMHLHEELTITAIKKGSLNLILNDTSYELKPNEIAIINSQIPHCATLKEESKDGYVLYLDKEYLKKIDFNFSSAFELIKNKNIYKNFIKLCDCLLDNKLYLIEKEENVYLFSLTFFSFEQTAKNIKEESKLAINIKKYLDEFFLEELILDDLALKFNLSVVHLIRVFKKEFGLPIHSYILNKKVHLAKELISLNMPIVEVAQNSGFFDQSHLNRSFKRVFQITPKEYQNNILK